MSRVLRSGRVINTNGNSAQVRVMASKNIPKATVVKAQKAANKVVKNELAKNAKANNKPANNKPANNKKRAYTCNATCKNRKRNVALRAGYPFNVWRKTEQANKIRRMNTKKPFNVKAVREAFRLAYIKA